VLDQIRPPLMSTAIPANSLSNRRTLEVVALAVLARLENDSPMEHSLEHRAALGDVPPQFAAPLSKPTLYEGRGKAESAVDQRLRP
jgi:hypothetical protein